MTKTMYDCAVLPDPPPAGYDVAAGYVYQAHHEAAHIWTHDDWRRAAATTRFLLPIATCWIPLGNAGADAHAAVLAWEAIINGIGDVRPCAFALDMEILVAESPGASLYADAWRGAIRSLGYHDIVYSSFSARDKLGDGPLWLGPPAFAGQSTVSGTVEIAQEKYLGTIDTNTTLDTVPFYQTHQAPPPDPPEEDVKSPLFSFTVPDAGTPDGREVVYLSDFLHFMPTTPESLAAAHTYAALCGITIPHGTMTKAQIGHMVRIGDDLIP